MKFGRVNFKITTLKCDRIKIEHQGSCYSQVVEAKKRGMKAELQQYTEEGAGESSIERAIGTN